jgi:hypothetical protein
MGFERMQNTRTFGTGFSIKIWLKFFGAVVLQPRFFFLKSPSLARILSQQRFSFFKYSFGFRYEPAMGS